MNSLEIAGVPDEYVDKAISIADAPIDYGAGAADSAPAVLELPDGASYEDVDTELLVQDAADAGFGAVNTERTTIEAHHGDNLFAEADEPVANGMTKQMQPLFDAPAPEIGTDGAGTDNPNK